jgi:hypothetical protein
MQVVPTLPASGDVKEWLRGRGTAGVLAVAVELLVIAALLTLGRGYLEPKKHEDKLATFQVMPDAKPAPRPASRATRVTPVKHDSGGAAPKSPTQDKPATPEPKPETPLFIPLTSQEMAAADIGHMASASGNNAGDGRSTGRDSGAAYGPGEGPGGERAYRGDWVRPPTPAEIGPYLPANLQSGEASIVCRAIPDNRVDNCRSLSETPGSGLGRALRLAAWQFHIRPTRIGSKFLVGQWVLIHFDFSMVVRK